MAELSKDLQAQLDALKSKSMSDDELDNVAGGTHQENMEVLNVMAQVDPKGTQALLASLQTLGPDDNWQGIMRDRLTILINDNFKRKGLDVNFSGSVGVGNMYYVGGKKMSHAKFLEFLGNYKAGGGDDF